MSEPLLPAVVLGIETPIGLAIIRDLGMRGVTVHGIARGLDAIGMSSRYLTQGHLRARGEEDLIRQLVALQPQLGAASLFAISESDIDLLNRHRERLGGFRLMFADVQRMASVLHKERTYAAAAAVGIRVPRTEQIGSMAEAAAVSSLLRYPVVLKWSNPNDVVDLLRGAGLALDKAHYCYDAEALLAYLRNYEKVGRFPLIQEYCIGFGLGQMILMHEGRAQYTFQHRRLHEWPPEGGFSTLCTSLAPEAHSMLMAQSIALLRALEWEGVAMVEYRHDPETGESALMEINGRFWGSLPLACHAGASFPWFCHRLLGMGDAIDPQPYRSGLRCRFMIPETKRLLRLLFQQAAITDRRLRFNRFAELAGYLLEFIRPGSCYYVFTWRDPLPFARDLLQLLRQVVPLPFSASRKAASGKTPR